MRSHIRNLGKKLRRSTDCVGSQFASPSVLMVFVYSDHDTATAVDYVQGRGRGPNFAPLHVDVAAAAEQVEAAYLEAKLEDLVNMEFTTRQFSNQSQLKAAVYVLQHRLFSWLAEMNKRHGLAPSRRQLIDASLACVPAAAPYLVQEHLKAIALRSPSSQRKFLRKFRQNWGARIGALRVQEEISLEDKRSKAWHLRVTAYDSSWEQSSVFCAKACDSRSASFKFLPRC